jgi:uncharacterized membrane protein
MKKPSRRFIGHFSAIDFAAVWTDVRLGIPLAQKVRRVSVVADQKSVRQVAEFGDLFTRTELKVVPMEELARARVWIAAD